MKAHDFFKLLGQIKDIKLVLQTYVKNPDVQGKPLTSVSYNKDIRLLAGFAEVMERAYLFKLQDDDFSAMAKQCDFIDVDLEFNAAVLAEIETAKQLVEFYSRKNFGGEKRQALVKTINAAFQIRFVILEFLQNEHDFVANCSAVDSARVVEIFERYKQGGLIPLLNEVAINDVGYVADTFGLLPLYGEIKNHLMMTLDTVWAFVENPLNGVEYFHKKIHSESFLRNFYEFLGEISSKYTALEAQRNGLARAVSHQQEFCHELLYSKSSLLSDVDRVQLKQYLDQENFRPHHDVDYQQFLLELSQKLGDSYTEELKSALLSVYYVERDIEFLNSLSLLLAQPMQRTMRYELTLKEINNGGKFDKIEAFYRQHLPYAEGADVQLAKVHKAKIYMKETLELLNQMAQAVNDMPRPFDEWIEHKNKIATLASKRNEYRKLLDDFIDKAKFLEKTQGRKSPLLNVGSYRRAEAKQLWLGSFRAQLELIREQQFLLNERTIEQCLADEKTLGQLILEAHDFALNHLPEKKQAEVFVGSSVSLHSNKTLDYWEDIQSQIERIEKIVEKALVFSQADHSHREQAGPLDAAQDERYINNAFL